MFANEPENGNIIWSTSHIFQFDNSDFLGKDSNRSKTLLSSNFPKDEDVKTNLNKFGWY